MPMTHLRKRFRKPNYSITLATHLPAQSLVGLYRGRDRASLSKDFPSADRFAALLHRRIPPSSSLRLGTISQSEPVRCKGKRPAVVKWVERVDVRVCGSPGEPPSACGRLIPAPGGWSGGGTAVPVQLARYQLRALRTGTATVLPYGFSGLGVASGHGYYSLTHRPGSVDRTDIRGQAADGARVCAACA
jgi:hypothetical protein